MTEDNDAGTGREPEQRQETLAGFLRLAAAWLAAKDRGWARLQIAGVLLVTLVQVFIQIRFNFWNRDFFNALENRDHAAFTHQIVIFFGLAVASMAASVYQLYLKQLIQLRWREWLTRSLIATWLREGRHYQLEMAATGADNPDQRIAEDVRLSTEMAVDFALGIVISLTMLFSFVGILWTLSGALPVQLGGVSLDIPGYMVWAALLYAAIGSSLTWLVGRPMVDINIRRTGAEADFRFGLTRARESGEGIALIRGEEDERRVMAGLFSEVRGAVQALMRSQRNLMWLTSAYGTIAMVFPTIVASPAYFAGLMTLGGLMQIGQAFGQVQTSLNWFVDNFPRIAEWRSAATRLATFREALGDLEALVEDPEQPTIAIVEGAAEEGREVLAFDNLEVAFADGTTVIEEASAEIGPGERVLIKGESGSGKSTLFRCIGGLWPWGAGTIRIPPREAMMFMPQRPYLPLGSLAEAVAYPSPAGEVPQEAIAAALERVGLGALTDRLEEEERWDRTLSLGEQQRLAFARMLLHRPRWLFMDEATSALDGDSQDALMRLAIAELPEATIVSIGHRPELEQFHDRTLTLVKTDRGARLGLRRRAQRRQRRGRRTRRATAGEDAALAGCSPQRNPL